MNRLTSVFVALAFLAGSAGLVVAQTTTTTPPPTPAEKKMEKADKKVEKTAEKADKKMTSKNASGTVKSTSADSVVVAGKDKGKDAEWTFAIDSKTKVKKAGKDAMAADLKAGDAVQVKYMDHDGKAVAQTVTVKGGGMVKKDEKPAEKK